MEQKPPAKKRKLVGRGDGGYKQQAERSTSAVGTSRPGDNKLADYLVRLTFWGLLSATMIQSIAQFAIADGASGRNLQTLADLGTTGEHKNNVWRDLLRRVKTGFVGCAQTLVSMPMLVKAEVVDRTVSLLLPHKLFHVMFTHHRSEFVYRLCNGSLENITRFWEDMQGHPCYENHPMHQHHRFDFKTKCIPLRLHGDGVTSIACGKIWARSVEALSWSSCLALVDHQLSHHIYFRTNGRGGPDHGSGVCSNILEALLARKGRMARPMLSGDQVCNWN